MRKRALLLSVICFLLSVLVFPPEIFSIEEKECRMPEKIGGIYDAADMENCAEEAMRPFGLGPQKDDWSLCGLSEAPVIGPFIELICRFRIDSGDVYSDLISHQAQITPEPPPELTATPAASLETEAVRAQGILDPIKEWLLRIIAGFTIRRQPSGHIAAALPSQFEMTKNSLGEMRAMEEPEEEGGQEDIVSGFDTLKRAYTPYALQPKREAEYTPPPEETISPAPPFVPLPVPVAIASLGDIFEAASDWAGVPRGVIEAMAMIEGRHLFNYSDQEIQKYSQPGAKDPINCEPNVCSAAGPMQLTTGKENADCVKCPAACEYDPNAWAAYKNAVNEATGEGRIPEVCNIKDSIFAATKKMKIDSGTPFGEKREWGKETIRRVATRYYGECWCCPSGGDWELCKPGREEETPACKRLGKSYCEYVWEYYQAHR